MRYRGCLGEFKGCVCSSFLYTQPYNDHPAITCTTHTHGLTALFFSLFSSLSSGHLSWSWTLRRDRGRRHEPRAAVLCLYLWTRRSTGTRVKGSCLVINFYWHAAHREKAAALRIESLKQTAPTSFPSYSSLLQLPWAFSTDY